MYETYNGNNIKEQTMLDILYYLVLVKRLDFSKTDSTGFTLLPKDGSGATFYPK
jgi:hypothetical protein